ncbi:hypothetical protein E4T42_05974 [Aureobasidium subglaciale]|nr:hypothetical protein E4T42_05974 [Aureobasidium subglaciale]
MDSCQRDKRNTANHPVSSLMCPFLGNPVEIRLKIYRLVLKVAGFRLIVGQHGLIAHDEKIPVWACHTQMPLTMPPSSEFLALLSVNKQIYGETMPEYYHENHFQFSNMVIMKEFLTNMGAERRCHMRASVG